MYDIQISRETHEFHCEKMMARSAHQTDERENKGGNDSGRRMHLKSDRAQWKPDDHDVDVFTPWLTLRGHAERVDMSLIGV